MPAPRPIPAEAFTLSYDEMMDLCAVAPSKELGGLIVATGEMLPATGWDPSADNDGLVLPRGSSDHIRLHAPKVTGVEQMQHQLVLAGSYIALHEDLRRHEYVVGVTFEPLGRLAVRAAGFSRLNIRDLSVVYEVDLYRAYSKMRLAERRRLQVAMVYMPTGDFIQRYASKRVGTDPEALIGALADIPWHGEEYEAAQASDDPVVEAINRVTNTMME
jgi:hypothetical protein